MFIDDHTRIGWVYLMREKSKAQRIFKEFHNITKNRMGVICTSYKTEYNKSSLVPCHQLELVFTVVFFLINKEIVLKNHQINGLNYKTEKHPSHPSRTPRLEEQPYPHP